MCSKIHFSEQIAKKKERKDKQTQGEGPHLSFPGIVLYCAGVLIPHQNFFFFSLNLIFPFFRDVFFFSRENTRRK